jgi:hypothetical protein
MITGRMIQRGPMYDMIVDGGYSPPYDAMTNPQPMIIMKDKRARTIASAYVNFTNLS